MKKKLLLAGLTAASAMAFQPALPAMAAEVTATLDLNSAYISKGQTVNDGFVLQPGMDITIYKGFYTAVWANIDLNDYNDVEAGDFSEVNLIAGYRFDLNESVSLGLSIAEYIYPVDDGNETEVIADYNVMLGMGFFIFGNFIYNIDVTEDIYTSLGLGYTYKLNDATSFTLKGSAGYVGSDWAETSNGGKESGLNEYLLTFAVDHNINNSFSINAHIDYTDNIDNDVLPDEAVDTQFFCGIGLAYSF